MTRSREQITTALLAELIKKAEANKNNSQALKALLIEELMLQQEADWAMLGYNDEQSKISHALSHLEAATEFETTADFHFYKKWKVSFNEAPHWRAFVANFAHLMQHNSGYKVGATYREKFGLVHASAISQGEGPSDHRIFSDEEVESKQVQQAQQLKKQQHQKKAFKEFCSEIDCWNESNLHRLFAEYLIALPQDADIKEQSINVINHVIPSLVNEIINPACSKRGFEGIDSSAVSSALGETSKQIEVLRGGFTEEAGYEWVIQITHEYKEEMARMHRAPLKKASDSELFKEYVNQLISINNLLYQAIEQEKSELRKINLLGAAKSMLAGSGIGLLVGGMVVGGLIAGGVLVSMQAMLVAFLALTLFVVAAGAIGYGVKKLYDNSRGDLVQKPAGDNASPVSSFLQTCSTSICAIVLGLTSCGSIAAPDLQDQLDPVAPISALDLDDDYDADDTETPSESSGTRTGPSKPT